MAWPSSGLHQCGETLVVETGAAVAGLILHEGAVVQAADPTPNGDGWAVQGVALPAHHERHFRSHSGGRAGLNGSRVEQDHQARGRTRFESLPPG